MGVSQNKQAIVKEAFRGAFFKLYAKKDISKISITEVAKVSGYNRATFYKHYHDVYDILREIENEIADSVQDFIFSLLQNQNPDDIHNISPKDLGPFWDNFRKFIEGNKVMFDVMFSKKMTESLMSSLREKIKKFFWFLIPPNLKNHLEAEILVSALTALQLDLFVQYLREPDKIGMERLIHFCYTFADLEFILIDKIFGKPE